MVLASPQKACPGTSNLGTCKPDLQGLCITSLGLAARLQLYRRLYCGSGSGGRISWDRNCFFHEIEFMRSNFLAVFMRSKFKNSIIRQSRSHDRFVSYKYDHEIKIQKSIISNFDLMIDLLVASTIMRSKFKINYSNLVSCTCG